MNETPDWFATGRTVLTMKDREKGNDVINCRPTARLSFMWKVITRVFSDNQYYHLQSQKLSPEEQKGCQRKLRGTKDQLLIDKTILKGRLTGLKMVWTDYKRAYDMVPP